MVYADSDFFLALLKGSDWLKKKAERLLSQYKGEIWTSGATVTELLLVAEEFNLDPEKLVVDVAEIAEVQGGAEVFLIGANYMKEEGATVFDSLHAAFCGKDKIISSDKVFDKLGLERVRLEAA